MKTKKNSYTYNNNACVCTSFCLTICIHNFIRVRGLCGVNKTQCWVKATDDLLIIMIANEVHLFTGRVRVTCRHLCLCQWLWGQIQRLPRAHWLEFFLFRTNTPSLNLWKYFIVASKLEKHQDVSIYLYMLYHCFLIFFYWKLLLAFHFKHH